MTLRDRLVATWYAPRVTALAAALLPLSGLFGLIVATRRALYRAGLLKRERAGVPVVVVGNLTVGGAGKTPLAIALAHALRDRGLRPGLVSRGYGGSARAVRAVEPGDDASIVGDEARLLAGTGFPVYTGSDRVAAVRALVAAHPKCDVVIADDGLQHYRLARDVEIVVVDETRGFGNGLLLPAGPLREPTSRLSQVDCVVRLVGSARASRGDGRATTMHHAPLRFVSVVDPARVVEPGGWPAGTVHALAGIGHPQRFFDLLARMGIDAVPHPFPDHHVFTPADLDIPAASAILMTAKDAVKCAGFADSRHFALEIRAVIDPALVDYVQRRLDGRQAA